MTEKHPGAKAFPDPLRKQLSEAVKAHGPDYQPRTRHLREDGTARFTNRLILDASPYLLQHAHNPVNWYPWGQEAFETARELDRPILLSIGYSTCHWCHVMEEESFEDLEIAEYLNEHYVAIKVDREQRPDVDSLYMTAVQALTGGGGWPMNRVVDAGARTIPRCHLHSRPRWRSRCPPRVSHPAGACCATPTTTSASGWIKRRRR